MKKVFIVGCPRSGTTLLQSLLASHPHIVSFPETHLFSKTIHINKFIRFFSIYGAKKNRTLKNILSDFGVMDINNQVFRPTLSTFKWGKNLIKSLESIAEKHKKAQEYILLEKTPRHLHYVDLIEQLDPEATFIHIIRKGEDVVASLHQATDNNPGQWSGARSIKKSIFWWNRSVKLSKKYIGGKNHIHIRYEDLVENPKEMIEFLCTKIGINYQPEMIESHHKTAKDIINLDENWKSKNTQNTISNSGRFEQLSQDIQNQIKKGLIDFNYSEIELPFK